MEPCLSNLTFHTITLLNAIFPLKAFPNFCLRCVYIIFERQPMILSNFCESDWQGGQDMPPVVTDLHVTDKDWQVSSCQHRVALERFGAQASA